jgi:hypothetical protein
LSQTADRSPSPLEERAGERRPFHTQVHGEVHGERELPNQIRALNPLNSSDTGVFSPSSSGRGGTGGSFLSARFMERGGPVTGS